jgi:hypothetical protein
VLTINRKHFIRLHLINPDHGGLIGSTQDADFAVLAHRIHEMLQQQPNMAG